MNVVIKKRAEKNYLNFNPVTITMKRAPSAKS